MVARTFSWDLLGMFLGSNHPRVLKIGHMTNYKIVGMHILSTLVRFAWRQCKMTATISSCVG